MSTVDPDKLVAKANKLTKLGMFRWHADWKMATLLYEQAAKAYLTKEEYGKSKDAFKKASEGHVYLLSHWEAAQDIVSAGKQAMKLNDWGEVIDLYKNASSLYLQCGRSQCASNVLVMAAGAVADTLPEDAVALYADACNILVEDNKEYMSFDLYYSAINLLIQLGKYIDAVDWLLKWSESAKKAEAQNSQCKAYVSVIIVYLYTDDFNQAWLCFHDFSEVNVFSKSDYHKFARQLLDAYKNANIEKIKQLCGSSTISSLSNEIIKLATKLPTGKVGFEDDQSGAIGPLDENDLT